MSLPDTQNEQPENAPLIRERTGELSAVKKLLSGGVMNRPGYWLAALAVIVGIAASLYHLYVPIVGAFGTFTLRPLHLLSIGALGLLCFDISAKPRDFSHFHWSWLIDFSLIILLFGAIANILADPGGLEERYAFGEATAQDTFFAYVLVLLVLEMARRCIGLPIAIFVSLILCYGLFGNDSFSVFKFRPIPTDKLFQNLYMTTDGIFGSPIGVMATYVFLFIIFGAFIERCQAGQLIQRVGLALTGRSPGGPAKVAIVTSATFGTISGSALANVMATGSVTIPLMKRIGFSRANAGGIEAAASAGGQLTPPIMGAVAFVMADITGIPYTEVILAATVPALLFYLSLFVAVDLTARREIMAGVPESMMPNKGDILRLTHMALPLVILVGVLVIGYSPMMAALAGIGSTIVLSQIRKETRLSFPGLLEGLHTAARTTVIATVACAAAGIVVGVINLTGLGLRLSSNMLDLAYGYKFLALILVMITCIVLGMGMPTVAAYIITIAIGAPILAELGVPTIAAHLFVLYFSVLSLITPPVMVASFGAAAIAEAKVIPTGIAAVKYAGLAFVMPFIFVYNPELLVINADMDFLAFGGTILTATGGALAFGVATSGYPARTIVERLLYLLVAYLLVDPNHGLDLIAVVLVAGHLTFRKLIARPRVGLESVKGKQ
ncbi:MAG: TRAP transporter permease [Pseudomonadota bacterium]